MTPEHQNHIQKIISHFDIAAYQKYLEGQNDHGGYLWTKAVWKQPMKEAIDQVIYLDTLNEQIEKLLAVCVKLAPNHPELAAVIAPFLNEEIDPPKEPFQPPSED